jgi:hypothetical protein
MADRARRKEHISSDGRTTVVAESYPGEDDWGIRHIDRTWDSGPSERIGRVPLMLYSAFDNRFSKDRFPTAEAAIAFALFRLACDWFAYNVCRLRKAIPRDAAMFQAALSRVRAARPQTVDEVKMRAVSMAHSLAIWGEMMFPQEKSLVELEALLD